MSSVDALRLASPLADRRDGSRVSPSGRRSRRRSRRSPSPTPMHRRRSPIPAPIHRRRSPIDLAPAHRHRRRSRTRSPTPIHHRRSSRSPPPAPIHRRCSSISPSPSAVPRRRSPSPRRRDDCHRWSPFHRPGRPSHYDRLPPIADDEDLKGLIITDYHFSKRQKLRMNLKSNFMWRITPSPPRGEWVLPESPAEHEEDDRKKPTRKSHVPDVSSSEAQSRNLPPKSRSRRKHTYSGSSEGSDSSESESDSSPTPKRRKALRRWRRQRRESSSDESEESDDYDSSLKRRKHKSSKRSKNKVSPSPLLSPSPAIEYDVALIEAKKPEIMLRAWKEKQLYSAEDKRALAMFNYEEKAKVMADLQRLVQRHIGQDTGPAPDPFAPNPLDAADD